MSLVKCPECLRLCFSDSQACHSCSREFNRHLLVNLQGIAHTKLARLILRNTADVYTTNSVDSWYVLDERFELR